VHFHFVFPTAGKKGGEKPRYLEFIREGRKLPSRGFRVPIGSDDRPTADAATVTAYNCFIDGHARHSSGMI